MWEHILLTKSKKCHAVDSNPELPHTKNSMFNVNNSADLGCLSGEPCQQKTTSFYEQRSYKSFFLKMLMMMMVVIMTMNALFCLLQTLQQVETDPLQKSLIKWNA